MKRLLLVAGLILTLGITALSTGCVRVNMQDKNGPLTTQNYDYTGFTGVDVGSAMKLDVSYGPSFNVTVTAGKTIIDKIHISRIGETLKFDIDGWSFNWWNNSMPKVSIVMPVLNYLHLSGAANGTVSGFSSTGELAADISGASHLDLDMAAGSFTARLSGASKLKGRLTATASDLSLSGASDIGLTGTGGDIKLHASGASSSSLRYYVVQNADVDFSGASSGSLDVRGILDVKLTGSSGFSYTGNPTLGSVNTSDGSDLKKLK
jgi:hypothetical protein